MIVIKLLGILDIFVAVLFWIFGIFHLSFLSGFILVLGFFLLIKGVGFAVTSVNIVSILDIICGLIIITAGSGSLVMPKLIVVILSLFLLQKGIFSMLS